MEKHVQFTRDTESIRLPPWDAVHGPDAWVSP